MPISIKIITVCCLFFVFACSQKNSYAETQTSDSFDKITVCSFNMQIFGVSKMSKPEVVGVLVDIVKQADVIAIQEVRSASTSPVEQFMSYLPEKYSFVLGPREGRTSSKEQYWVIYDTTKLSVAGFETYPDFDDKYERNPLGVYFQANGMGLDTKGNFDFILINNHVSPSDAGNEINAITEVVSFYKGLWSESDVLIVGDFNADGQYYNELFLEDVFPENDYTIIITNDYDTTLAASSNTYDRIIITKSAVEDYTGSFGIIRFDEIYDFGSSGIFAKDISDHYPVWAEFFLYMDTD